MLRRQYDFAAIQVGLAQASLRKGAAISGVPKSTLHKYKHLEYTELLKLGAPFALKTETELILVGYMR